MVVNRRNTYISLFFLFTVTTFVVSSLYADVREDVFLSKPVDASYSDILSSLNMEAIKTHIKFFAGLNSRVTGYSGCDEAAKYIYNYFTKLGLSNVSYHEFSVATPIDYGATFQLTEQPDLKFNVYALKPNAVVPVTAHGISAPVVYAGDGELDDLNGKAINSSTVLINYRSGRNWINAAKFGAKAVIFIEPDDTTFWDSVKKSVELPFNFPRLYMPKEDAERLLEVLSNSTKPVYANMTSKMVWENRVGRNVLALIGGSTYKDQILMLTAHYDSYSVVPSVAPGANDAVGAATLLEMARLFTLSKLKYTVLFVAFSGYHQAISGSRWFVDDFFFANATNLSNIGSKVILQVNLQLSTESDILATANVGPNYLLRENSGTPLPVGIKAFDDFTIGLMSTINQNVGKSYKIFSGVSETSLKPLMRLFPSGLLPNDCEPLALNQGPGYSIMTADYYNLRWSPTDTYDKINLNNLRNNMEGITLLLYGIVQTDGLKGTLQALGYERMRRLGFRISGKIATYNESIADYTNVPNALVYVTFAPWATWGCTFLSWVVMANENGRIYIPQITSGTSGGGDPYILLAFKLDEAKGNPVYSPTSGKYQWTSWPVIAYGKDVDFGYYTVFRSATVVLFDLIYPPTMSTARVPRTLDILDAVHTRPDSFGYSILTDDAEGFSMAVAYVPPDVPIEIVTNTPHLGGIPLAFLTNATAENPEGQRFRIRLGDQYNVYCTPLQIAKDLSRLTTYYIHKAEPYGIAGSSQSKIAEVESLLNQAEAALTRKEYNRTYMLSIEAWMEARETYSEIRLTITETSSSIVFFGLTIIPFVILFESLAVAATGKRKILSLISVFALTLAVFYIVHPSFALAANSMMVIVGFIALVLIFPVIGILFGNFSSFITKTAIKKKGMHFVPISKGSAVILAFDVAVRNLKRRKLRTSLTLITVLLIVFALVAFTSVLTIKTLKPTIVPQHPLYQGIYVRDTEWLSIGRNIINILKTKYSDRATILPRAWFYNILPADTEKMVLFTARHEGRTYDFYAALGLTPDEASQPWVGLALSEGKWFSRDETDVTILTKAMANALDARVGERISALGRNLTVVGIVDSTYVDSMFKELDNEGITPWDATIANQNHIHVASRVTLIVPYDTLLLCRPRIASVSVVVAEPDEAPTIAKEIFETFDELYMFNGAEDGIMLYTRAASYVVMGWQMQLIPIVLGIVMILNIMLGSVYERTRETFTYATVGLSPLHVSFILLTESSVYAIVGAVIGYVVATITTAKLSTVFSGAVIGNYSSTWVLIPVGIAILITTLSTLYPMRRMSRLVTPSLERAWKAPTKPVGDTWSIPMPFVASDDAEATGICKYLTEFVQLHGGEAEIFSTTNVSYTEEKGRKTFEIEIRLAPYEEAIKQKVRIDLNEDPETRKWKVGMLIMREAGSREAWVRLNRRVLDEFRKQFLTWRFLKPEERAKYSERS